MKKIIVAAVLACAMLVSGCAAESASGDLFKYKNTKIGNASKLNAIVNELPGHDQFEGLELQTDNEPYEMKVFYETAEGEFTDEMMMHNATVQFVLIENADIITFVIDDDSHTVKREVLEDWYGQELKDIKTKEDLAELEKEKPANSGEISMIFEN